jgi:hypothetical protein
VQADAVVGSESGREPLADQLTVAGAPSQVAVPVWTERAGEEPETIVQGREDRVGDAAFEQAARALVPGLADRDIQAVQPPQSEHVHGDARVGGNAA